MSDFMNNDQTTSTRLMRIALVGVRPADKILMKEYMRLLFGLKIGIDWVLVSHPNVDLFLVGSEFRKSSVVIKLLSDQEDKPVLHVSHNDDYEGQLIDNHLFLPVASLEVLKEWLLASVTMLEANNKAFNDFSFFEESSVLNPKVLSESGSSDITPLQQNKVELTQPATELTTSRTDIEIDATEVKADTIQAKVDIIQAKADAIQSKADIIQAKADAIQAKADATVAKGTETGSLEISFSSDSEHPNTVVTPDTAMSQIPPALSVENTLPMSSSTQMIEGYDCILKLIEYVQQRVSGLYQITINKQLIAIIEPSRGRVWSTQRDVNTSSLSLDLNWQLQPYTGPLLAEDKADDLIQYLWQYGWMSTHWLLPLVNDDSSYQLEYWIKPVLTIVDNTDDPQPLARIARQKLLAIMNALEFAPHSIRQLSELTSTPIKATNKIVASLLFAGSVTAVAQPASTSSAIFDIVIRPEHGFSKKDDDAKHDNAHDVKHDDAHDIKHDNAHDVKHDNAHDVKHDNAHDVLIAPQIPTDEFFVDSQPAKPVPEQKAKQGFLSRLRNKLGL